MIRTRSTARLRRKHEWSDRSDHRFLGFLPVARQTTKTDRLPHAGEESSRRAKKQRVSSTGVLACVVFSLAAQSIQAATLPRKSPEFAIQMPDGKQLLLSSYKGKPVCLAFILTTCSHCQAFTRLLIKAQNEFGPRGLQAVESAIEEKAAPAVPGFVRAFQPPFPVGYNDHITTVDFLQHPRMEILHMPAIVFIGHDRGAISGQ